MLQESGKSCRTLILVLLQVCRVLYGNQRVMVSATDSEISDKNTGNEEEYKNCQERCTKLVYLIFLQKVADYAHPAAVWCSLTDGTVDQWLAYLRVCV